MKTLLYSSETKYGYIRYRQLDNGKVEPEYVDNRKSSTDGQLFQTKIAILNGKARGYKKKAYLPYNDN